MEMINVTGIPVSKFVQQTPSATWSIVHGRGKFLLFDVTILIDGKNEVVYPNDVEYSADLNSITITFSQPRAGFVSLVDYDTGVQPL